MVGLTFVLLLLGVMLLCAEMFMPGFGICGIMGIIVLVVSAVITVLVFPFGVFVVLGETVGLTGIILVMLRYLKKRQLYGKLVLNESLNTEEKEIGDLDYFMNKEGVTKSTLRPFGVVDFNGVPIEVCSDGPYISENVRVKVVSVTKQKIIVKAQSQQERSDG